MEEVLAENDTAGPSISPSLIEWDKVRERIRHLYEDLNLSLSEVMTEMSKSGFVATERMYKKKLTSWNMGKNACREDWLAFAKLYESGQVAGSGNIYIKIRNKVRRIEDLRKYLKNHRENEKRFFAEALSSNKPTPLHVRYCNSDGLDHEQTEDGCLSTGDVLAINKISGTAASVIDSFSAIRTDETFEAEGQCDFTHQYTQIADEFGQMEELDFGLPQSQLVDEISSSEFFSGQPQLNLVAEHSNQPLDSREIGPQLHQEVCSVLPAPFSGMSKLSSFRLISRGLHDDWKSNEFQNDGEAYFTADIPSNIGMIMPVLQAQTSLPAFMQDGTSRAYMTACMQACMFGAARRNDLMKLSLQQVSSRFRQLCETQSCRILVAASIILSWLLVHTEGSLATTVMTTSLHIAAEMLGDENPVCMLLEWMSAASSTEMLATCRLGSEELTNLWLGFNQKLGEEHSHTIVALYCLCFQMMFADKDFAGAEKLLRLLRIVSTKVFGSSHIQTINILAALSRSQQRQKKFSMALETIDESLKDAPMGLNHPHRLELLVRKAIILGKLDRKTEMEELYWIVVKGRVATLGVHHKTTIAAHSSLVQILHWNNTWESKKAEVHKLLAEPQVSVTEYESWWRRVVEAARAEGHQHQDSSEEESL